MIGASDLRFALSRRALTIAVGLVAFAIGVTLHGLIFEPAKVWPNLLHNGFYFLSLAIAGLFFLAGQRVSGARWSAGLRRVPEAFMLLLPVAAVLMLVLGFGRETLFPWTQPGFFDHEPAIAGRARYLTQAGVAVRALATFAVWTLCAWWMRRLSLAQDRAPASALALHHRLNRTAALFMVLFAPSFTCASYDWILSREPHWFSTMFAVYAFAGTFVQGIAGVTLAVVLLRERGHLHDVVGPEQLHDLGKMLFAFSIFWAYIWVCQYLLIWYGNIPEEVTYYVKRTHGAWLPLFALNFAVNWVIPFLTLLSVRAKREPRVLAAVSILLLGGHWLDLFIMLRPADLPAPTFSVYEPAIGVGYLALAFVLVARNLGRAPLVPTCDPVLAAERAQAALAHS